MKKLIFLFSFFIYSYGYIDLGQHAEVFEIEEESLISVIERNAKLVDKEALKNEIIGSIESSLTIHNEISTCQQTIRKEIIPSITAEEDIIEPVTNRVIVKKGTTKNLFSDFGAVMTKHILFINADDEIQKRMALQFYKDVDIYVVKGNAYDLLKMNIPIKAVPYQKMIEILQLNCAPSFYTQNEEKIIVDEINVKDFLNPKE